MFLNWLTDSDASYRWGQIAICLFFLILTVLCLTACGPDADLVRQQAVAEQNAKIARACIPEKNEQRVLQWAVVDGQYLLYLTIREPLAPRPHRPAQFVITSEQELPL